MGEKIVKYWGSKVGCTEKTGGTKMTHMQYFLKWAYVQVSIQYDGVFSSPEPKAQR